MSTLEHGRTTDREVTIEYTCAAAGLRRNERAVTAVGLRRNKYAVTAEAAPRRAYVYSAACLARASIAAWMIDTTR